MNTNEKECKGALRVSQDVISEIAAAAACEVDGVLCNKKDVTVKYVRDVAEISLTLTLKDGVRAVACAETVQNAVKSGVQNMTGITVSRVNIKI